MATKPKKKAPRKLKRLPRSAESKAATQAIIQADLLGLEADRVRASELSKGAYAGGPVLRSSGTTISTRYLIGKPKADKGWKNLLKPPPVPGLPSGGSSGGRRKPTTSTPTPKPKPKPKPKPQPKKKPVARVPRKGWD